MILLLSPKEDREEEEARKLATFIHHSHLRQQFPGASNVTFSASVPTKRLRHRRCRYACGPPERFPNWKRVLIGFFLLLRPEKNESMRWKPLKK